MLTFVNKFTFNKLHPPNSGNANGQKIFYINPEKMGKSSIKNSPCPTLYNLKFCFKKCA
jgi:hypothetical protein